MKCIQQIQSKQDESIVVGRVYIYPLLLKLYLQYKYIFIFSYPYQMLGSNYIINNYTYIKPIR